MTAKITSLDTDYIVQEYRAKRTSHDIARELGVSVNTILRRLKAAGVEMRPSANAPAVNLPVNEVCSMFRNGTGVRGIANHFGCSPRPVERILRDAGIPLRDRSAQQAARMAKATPEERKALAESAHEAVRGRIRSWDERCAAANTKEERQTYVSEIETRLASMLAERGLDPVSQKAIGPYNCDLSFNPVAVEVFGGGWHWHGAHIARAEERFRYMMDQGWTILAIAIDSRRWPLTDAVADYLASEIKRLRSNPPAVSEYRVIWGAGEFTTGGRLDDDHFSIEPPFTSARDPETGEYRNIPR